MFAKQKLSTAIAMTMGATMGGMLVLPTANADSLFFPHVVVSDSVTTIISVVNTSDANYPLNGERLHYQLYWKGQTILAGKDVTNSQPCSKVDAYRSTSYMDIQTIDLGDVLGAPLGVMFDDPSINNNWFGANQSYAFGAGKAPMRGYMLIDNLESQSADGSLAGEAWVFDFDYGATWGYEAYRNTGNEGKYDFTATASRSPAQVAIAPFDQIATAFMVTPVGNMTNPALTATIDFAGTDQFGNPFALFDRDENPVSGSVPQSVVCIGRVDAEDLLTAPLDVELLNGGWGYLRNYRGLEEPAAVVIKLEYGFEDFAGLGMMGAFNNAIMYRPYYFDNVQ